MVRRLTPPDEPGRPPGETAPLRAVAGSQPSPPQPMNPIIDIANPPAGAIPATIEQLRALGLTDADIAAGEKRGEMETRGPWGTISRYSAITEAKDFTEVFPTKTARARFWPARSLENPRESGYQLEGRVSIGGRKVRAFTASQLFELPDGRLIDVATIFACL